MATKGDHRTREQATNIAAAAKLAEKLDSTPTNTASRRSIADGTGAAAPPGERKQPNLKRLFRLLAKPGRAQLFDQIKAELLEHGADPTIKDKSGRSVLEVVDRRSRERQTIIDLLETGKVE